MVKVFKQHRECGVLDLEFGFGEIAALAGLAVEANRVLDFLTKAKKLEGGLDLVWELGDFRGEHDAVAIE